MVGRFSKKCWIIFIIWLFICKKLWLSLLYRLTKISYCLFFDRLLNWGIYCSTWSKSILLSSVKSQQHVTKCSEFSFGSTHKHFLLSILPTGNLCEFKLDLSTLIWVKRVHSFFWPLEKCLYFFGLWLFFSSNVVNIHFGPQVKSRSESKLLV